MEKRQLDTILKEINSFGRFQLIYLIVILVPVILSQGLSLSFAFTTGDLNYRCYIDECDTSTSVYNGSWVENAVPFEKNKPAQCFRYVANNIPENEFECSLTDNFDHNHKIECDRFVYETNERTIVNDFNMTCDGNKWLLALPGTLHNVGYFINLLLTGYISDKYGRKLLFIFSSLIAATMGIMKSFSWNYISFLLFECIDPLLSSGIFVSSFVLAMEILVPEHRGIAGAAIFTAGAIGKVLLGLSAMLLQNWRNLLRVNLSFTYFIIIAFWIFPESVRWLITKNRHQEASVILLKIARTNRVELEPDLKDLLTNRPQDILVYAETTTTTDEVLNKAYKPKLLLKYPKMIQRVIICAFCWITNTLVFYGLSLISITIGGNKYVNFMVVQVIEVPAYIFIALFAHKVGRKKLESGGFLISAIILFIYTFFKSTAWLKFTLFLLGKVAISIAFSTMYVYTTELFPTSLRHTLVAFSSAAGRIGSIVAPQTPYLETLVENLSIYLFCGMGLIAGLLCLLLPETLNKKLPDTMEEALNIGESETSEKSRL